MTVAASRVYVLHFTPRLRHAQHYIGVALDGDVRRRVDEHLRGLGSPLVTAALEAGIDVQLATDLPGDRRLERRLKNRHRPSGTYAICPICRDQHESQPPLPFPTTKESHR